MVHNMYQKILWTESKIIEGWQNSSEYGTLCVLWNFEIESKINKDYKKSSKYHSRPYMLWNIGIESKSNKDNRNYQNFIVYPMYWWEYNMGTFET